jgi:hypothetical protein
LKKADLLLLLPGVGGTWARVNIVRSDKDGRGPFFAATIGDESSLPDVIIVSLKTVSSVTVSSNSA